MNFFIFKKIHALFLNPWTFRWNGPGYKKGLGKNCLRKEIGVKKSPHPYAGPSQIWKIFKNWKNCHELKYVLEFENCLLKMLKNVHELKSCSCYEYKRVYTLYWHKAKLICINYILPETIMDV